MAEVDEQTKRDALFIFEALKHVTTKVIVNAGEIALKRDVKINTIETRFSAIKKRHNLNISTTTSGFSKQKPSTPKKLLADPQLKAIEGSAGSNARPAARSPKPSVKKRQADEDGWYDDGASTPSKRHMSDMDEVKDEEHDAAAWHVVVGDHYDGGYVLDVARGLGY